MERHERSWYSHALLSRRPPPSRPPAARRPHCATREGVSWAAATGERHERYKLQDPTLPKLPCHGLRSLSGNSKPAARFPSNMTDVRKSIWLAHSPAGAAHVNVVLPLVQFPVTLQCNQISPPIRLQLQAVRLCINSFDPVHVPQLDHSRLGSPRRLQIS